MIDPTVNYDFFLKHPWFNLGINFEQQSWGNLGATLGEPWGNFESGLNSQLILTIYHCFSNYFRLKSKSS